MFSRSQISRMMSTGQFTALSLVDLPAYDFSAKNIQKQVKVKIDADDPSRQIRNVPAEQLIGGRCTQCTRLAALLFGSLRATVLKLALSFENAVKGRLRGDVLARIGQSGNDLAGREMPELIRVGHRQQGLALQLAETVLRRLHPGWALVPPGLVTLPALQGALTQGDGATGMFLAGAGRDGLVHQFQHLAAL